jgi:serine/threonine protein kinase
MKECNHPLAIKYIENFLYLNQLCIVTSYASGGNLRELIDKHQDFTFEEIMNYFLMILLTLHYLHCKDIMHRDLNPRNVLVDLLPNGLKIL